MGDAPGDIGPGGGALRGDQGGDVVEGDDEALELAGLPFGGDAHQQIQAAAIADDRDLGLGAARGPVHGLFHQGRHFRHGGRQLAANQRIGPHRQQGQRRAVGKFDTGARIEADDPGGDTGQHGFREPPSAVELLVGLDKLLALAVELAGHAVEGARQAADFIVCRPLIDAHREIAGPHPLGGGDEVADGAPQSGGETQPDPHRCEQEQQGDQAEDQGECDLDTRTLAFEPLVF